MDTRRGLAASPGIVTYLPGILVTHNIERCDDFPLLLRAVRNPTLQLFNVVKIAKSVVDVQLDLMSV